MELHPLTAPCRENIRHTYLSLARANPGTRIEVRDGYTLARSELTSPVSNFVIGLDVAPPDEPRLWNELRELAEQTRATRVFVGPGDRPSETSAFFRQPQWWCGYRIEVMVAEGKPTTDGAELNWATSHEEREAVTALMSEQFFSRMSAQARDLTRKATELADVELGYLGNPDDVLAAVMVTESSEMLGIYNLVVRKDRRGAGIGSQIVDAIRTRAYAQNRSTTLQCDGSLGPWYQARGFKMLGNLSTFHLNLGNLVVR